MHISKLYHQLLENMKLEYYKCNTLEQAMYYGVNTYSRQQICITRLIQVVLLLMHPQIIYMLILVW